MCFISFGTSWHWLIKPTQSSQMNKLVILPYCHVSHTNMPYFQYLACTACIIGLFWCFCQMLLVMHHLMVLVLPSDLSTKYFASLSFAVSVLVTTKCYQMTYSPTFSYSIPSSPRSRTTVPPYMYCCTTTPLYSVQCLCTTSYVPLCSVKAIAGNTTSCQTLLA